MRLKQSAYLKSHSKYTINADCEVDYHHLQTGDARVPGFCLKKERDHVTSMSFLKYRQPNKC